MSRARACAALLLLLASATAFPQQAGNASLPSAVLAPADTQIIFPAAADSNSPAYWRDGDLHVFNSLNHPYHSVGGDLASLRDPGGVSNYEIEFQRPSEAAAARRR